MMDPYWIMVGPSQVTDVLVGKGTFGHRHLQRECGYVWIEAGTGEDATTAKELKDFQQPPGVRRHKERFFSGHFRENMAPLRP